MNDENGLSEDSNVAEVEENSSEPLLEESAPSAEATEGENSPPKSDNDPLYVQKRLKRQERNHAKELRAMQEQISQLRSQMSPQANNSTGMYGQQPQTLAPQQQMNNPYTGQMIQPGSEEERIMRAIQMDRQMQQVEAKKAQDALQAQHVQRKYQDLSDRLDRGADKYDDFEDVVRAPHANFTPAMRDAALLIENPDDVLYKIGKDPDLLDRISKLHPLDQAREVNKLSFALMNGNTDKTQSSVQPLNPLRANPANASPAVTEKTPVSSLIQRIRARGR